MKKFFRPIIVAMMLVGLVSQQVYAIDTTAINEKWGIILYYKIGIDVGSTTLKTVILNEKNLGKQDEKIKDVFILEQIK